MNILPRRLPFYNLLNVRLKKVRLFAAVGDSSNFDGLILMSASAFFIVLGEIGEAKPGTFKSSGSGVAGFNGSE